MGRLSIIVALPFCPLLALRAEPHPVPPFRAPADPRVLAALEKWRGRGFAARAEFAPGNARLRAVSDIRWTSGDPPAGPGSSTTGGRERAAARTARAFLGAEADLVGIGLSDLGAPAIFSGPAHFTARFEQLHRDPFREPLPVLGGWVVVGLDASGTTVASFASSVVPGLRPPAAPLAGAADALAIAARKLGAADPPRLSRLAAARWGGRDRLVWDLRVRARGRPFRLLVDAVDGEVLGIGDLLRRAPCEGVPPPRGLVFAPSPAEGPPALAELPALDCRSPSLSGEWARVHQWIGEDPGNGDPLFELEEDGRVPAGPDGGVLFDAPDLSAIARTNVYLHATLFHDFLAGLGFHGLDRPFPAVVNVPSPDRPSGGETAWYDPLFPYPTGPGLMVFGAGPSLNLGLDGGLVYHEYLHAAIEGTARLGDDFFQPDLFFSLALGEGFADYFAASFAGDPLLRRYSSSGGASEPAGSLEDFRRWPDQVDAHDPHATGLVWAGCLWEIRQAFSGGGSGSAGIERADRLAYACLTSLLPDSDLLRAASALLAAAGSSGLPPAEVATVREVLGRRGLAHSGAEPPVVFQEVSPGGSAAGEAPPGQGAPRLAPVGYRVESPADGVRLTLELLTGAPGGLGLHARYGSPVTISGGAPFATHHAQVSPPGGTLVIDAADDPPLTAGWWFLAISNRGTVAASYRLTVALSRGEAAEAQPLGPAGQVSAVFAGNSTGAVQYFLPVPEAAGKRLEISASSPAEFDLHLRHGAPVASGADGEALADLTVRFPAGGGATFLDGYTLPSLIPGTYYLQLRNRSPERAAVTLRAALAAAPPRAPEEVPLAPGQRAGGVVAAAPAGARLLHFRQYPVAIAGDAVRLRVSLTTAGDLGLYARRGAPVGLAGRRLLFDHGSRLADLDGESLSIDLSGSPALEPETYYLAVLNHRSGEAGYQLSVALDSVAPAASIAAIESGVPVTGTAGGSGGLPAGELAQVQYALRIAGPSGLDALLAPEVPADLDLYLRRGRPVQMIGGNVVADHRALSERGAEAITILPGDLEPGEWHLAIVNRSESEVPFRLLAAAGEQALSVRVESGQPIEGTLPGAPGPPLECARQDRQFVVEVPAGAVRLEALVSPDGGGSLRMLYRRGSRVLSEGGAWIHDGAADSRDGPLVVEGAALRPGRWFFALANCEADVRRYRALFRVEVPSRSEIPLENGVFAAGVAEAASPAGPALHGSQYRIDVPPGTAELSLAVGGGECAAADLDLLVAYGERVEIDRTGRTNARWRAERTGAGGEALVLTGASEPPLAPGRYYLAVRNRERSPAKFGVGARASAVASLALAPGGSSGAMLSSGESGVGRLHAVQYRLEVFPGAEEAVWDLAGDGDVDLLLRYGLPVAFDEAGRLLSDNGSSAPGPAAEHLEVPEGGGCLRPGTYYAAVANFDDHPLRFTLKGEVRGTPAVPARIGQVIAGSAPPGGPATPRPGDAQIRLEVPAGSGGFQAELVAEEPSANLDLFLRQGSPVEFGAAVSATWRSEGAGGIEAIAVPASRVVPGPYYLAVASRAPSRLGYRVRLRPLGLLVRDLAPGVVEASVAPPSSTAGIGWLAPEQFRVRARAGEALWFAVTPLGPESPLEFHLRAAAPVEAEGTGVISDRSAAARGAARMLRIAAASGDTYLAVRNSLERDEPFLIEAGSGPWALPGDADESGQVDLTDPIAILFHLFVSGPAVCAGGADADGSRSLELTDAVYLLDFLFLAGPQPVPPYPDCAPPREPAAADSCTGAGCAPR